jgi:hypothetical protein
VEGRAGLCAHELACGLHHRLGSLRQRRGQVADTGLDPVDDRGDALTGLLADLAGALAGRVDPGANVAESLGAQGSELLAELVR